MINILSIDWDYFIGATNFQRAHFFPDSVDENISMESQSLLWNRSYAHSSAAKDYCDQNSIIEITVLDDEIPALCALVEKYRKPNTKMSIHESHIEIANVISFNYSCVDEINVFNIDSQHDCDTDSSPSGIRFNNWGRVLLHRKEIQRLFWVKHDDSAEDESGIIIREYNNIRGLHHNPETLSEGIDYIFLCRSAMRTPPHLDDYFSKTALHLANLIGLAIPFVPEEMDLRWTKKEQNNIDYLTGMKRIINEHITNRHEHGEEYKQAGLQKKINQYEKDYCEEHGLEVNETQLSRS